MKILECIGDVEHRIYNLNYEYESLSLIGKIDFVLLQIGGVFLTSYNKREYDYLSQIFVKLGIEKTYYYYNRVVYKEFLSRFSPIKLNFYTPNDTIEELFDKIEDYISHNKLVINPDNLSKGYCINIGLLKEFLNNAQTNIK